MYSYSTIKIATSLVLYVSVMSKLDYPSSLQATPGAVDSQDITAWGQGFESEKFSTVLKKNAETSRFPEGSLQIKCSCAVSCVNFCKNSVDVSVLYFGLFNNKCLGHRTAIFANGRSSLKFCVSYITGTFVKIPSISRLFPGVFFICSQ